MGDFWLQLHDSVTIFLGIVVEATPFILLGVTISAFLAHYVKTEKLLKILPKNRFLTHLAAVFMGFLFPVCECGNIPVARRFLQKGVKPSVVLTFLLAAPVLNPVVIGATWVAFRDQPSLVVLRIVFSFLIAYVVGIFMSYHPKQESLLAQKIDHVPLSCDVDYLYLPWGKSKVAGFLRTAVNEFFEMFALLVFGALMATVVQLIVPRSFMLSLGQGPILSVVAMMFFAFVISVCSTVDSFVALAYTGLFTTGSLLAFLIYGPIMDIKTLFMLRSVFSVKAVTYLFVLLTLLVLAVGLFINLQVSTL